MATGSSAPGRARVDCRSRAAGVVSLDSPAASSRAGGRSRGGNSSSSVGVLPEPAGIGQDASPWFWHCVLQPVSPVASWQIHRSRRLTPRSRRPGRHRPGKENRSPRSHQACVAHGDIFPCLARGLAQTS